MTDLTFNIAALGDAFKKIIELGDSVERVGVKLDELDHKRADPKINVETTEANAKIDELKAKLDSVGNGGGSGGGIGKGGLIGGALALGAGPIVGAGLLALPAAILAIGVAAEHTNPQVVTAFGNLTAAAKQTAQQGFSPLVPSLVQFANEAQGALGAVQGNLTDSAQAAAPLLTIIGSGFIKATQQGIGAAVPIVQGLRPVAQALGDDLVKAEQGVMGFFGKLQPGPAAQGLTELGTAVQEVLPPIGQLVNDIVPLGNDLLGVAVPALTNTAGAAHLLAVPLQAAGSVVSFLGPAIGAAVPPVLALAAGARLLTGSWTDFSGAGAKLIAPLQNIDGTLTGLGNKIGITTAAQNADNKVTVEAALVRAQLAKQTAEATALEAAFAAQEVGTAEAELAAVGAADELAAADAALVEAETAAAGAAEGLTFSLGPIGLILGVAAAGAAAFAIGSNTASSSAQDLSQQIVQLGQATPSAAAGLVSSSVNLRQISGDLTTVGSSAQQFALSFGGSAQHAQEYIDSLADSQRRLGASSVNAQKLSDVVTQGLNRQDAAAVMGSKNIAQLAEAVNKSRDAYNALNPSLRAQVDEYNAYNNVLPQAKNALADMKAAQQAESQVLVQEGIVLSATTKGWNSYGLAIGQRGTDFNSATAGIKSVTDNLLGANSAFFGAQANFAQLDAAVVSADQAYQQSAAGVANAQHALGQASQGVTQARQGEQQAVLGVTNAEDQLAKAQQAERQSQVGLTLARQQAAQALKDLQRQVIDQGDTEAEAQLRLLDAQNAVNAAGLGGKTLAGLGGPTTANEANYKLLLTLQEAQHNLNDVTAQGQQLAAQNAAAQAAGVDGSQQVLAAQQQVTQAQQQAKQAAQALQQAQQGVAQASQAVANAQWGEQQASAAVKQASQAQRTAAQALTQAKADDSRSTDINSAAGLRNSQTIEQLFEANLKATGDIGLATLATEAQGTQMGIAKGAVDGVITSLTKVPATTPFAIVGTPSLNLSALIQQSSAQGISPWSLGLPRADVQLAIDNAHGKAAGGLISGPGTGTSDSIPAITNTGGLLRVSNKEYIVNAAATAQNFGLLEAINSGAYRGLALGGQVDSKSLMGVNYRLAGWDGFLQGTSSILQTFGIRAPNLPAGNGSVDFGGLGIQLSTAGGSLGSLGAPSNVSGNRAANKAIMQQVFAQYGWGPGTAEWAAQDYVEMREAGYNNLAQNPTSTAFGMGQFLDSTWAGYGPKTADPTLQSQYMARYEKGRYNGPIGAAAHEKAFNWYRDGGIVDALRAPKVRDNGGPIDPGWNMIYNGTGRAETSRSGAQEDALLAELRAMRKDMRNLQSVSVAAPQGSSATEVADMVMRRLAHRGRG